VADVDILAAAPPALIASGYGDLLGKVPAGADWIVADGLGVEPVDPAIWAMVQGPLRAALDQPGRLRAGDPAQIEQFFLGLVLSGLAMQAARSSRPASGAEHLLSHLWEMTGLMHAGREPSHGNKVGVGTVLTTALYERLADDDIVGLDVDTLASTHPLPGAIEAEVRAALPAGTIADRAVVESLAKHPSPDELRGRLTRLRERWPDLRKRCQAQLLPSSELRERLQAVGASSRPTDIGLTNAQVRESLVVARQIRRRYTIFDLLDEAGLLTPTVAAVAAAEAGLGNPGVDC
jgi:glycerol-1-phosphate dehydrogenase [NAD(P)+]